MRPHKNLRGHIHYTSSKPGREGVERGREHFTITVHGDGRRTLRAHCEIDDEPNVLRDVTLTKNKHWETLDAFVRLSLGDEQQGRELGRLISVAIQSELVQQKRPGGLLA